MLFISKLHCSVLIAKCIQNVYSHEIHLNEHYLVCMLVESESVRCEFSKNPNEIILISEIYRMITWTDVTMHRFGTEVYIMKG